MLRSQKRRMQSDLEKNEYYNPYKHAQFPEFKSKECQEMIDNLIILSTMTERIMNCLTEKSTRQFDELDNPKWEWFSNLEFSVRDAAAKLQELKRRLRGQENEEPNQTRKRG